MPKLFPCEIVVTQDGQPLSDAVVIAQPVDGSQWNASGSTDANGKAVLFTQGLYKGAIEGKYKVIVQKTATEKEPSTFEGKPATVEVVYYLVEEKYRDYETTPLEIEVGSANPSFVLEAGKAVKSRAPAR
ncbi:MAG: hypothetical protein LBU65_14900 [Planctomycetaceae bacterium]|nr:hypothetical protein [Planctomycetaceae bacterium]